MPRKPAAPITNQEREHVLELHKQGWSRNKIAKKTGRGAGTITNIVKAAGGTFERSQQLKDAVKAKQVDNAARRAELQSGLLDDAIRMREQLFTPMTLHSFGGRDNTYNSQTVTKPPPKELRDIVGAISNAITAAVKLATVDKDSSKASDVDAWLDTMLDSQPDPEPADG